MTQTKRRLSVLPARGFTLIEIMIVVLIIGVLLAIAVPNFTRARESARQKACIANLRMINSAKEMYALDKRVPAGQYVGLTELIGTYIAGQSFGSSTAESQALEFRCPSSGGLYGPDMGVIGELPLCPTVSQRSGPFAHTLVP